MADDLAQEPAVPTNSTPPPAAPGSEEAELLALHQHDPQTFEHSPTWKGTGQTAAQRLYDLRKATADAQDGAEQTEDDDLAGVDVDAIDLDAPVDDPEAGEGDEAEEVEERAPLKAWKPPEGQEVSELAKPHLAALDGVASDEKQRDGIIDIYNKMVEQQTTRLAEINKSAKAEMVASLKEELGANYADFRRGVDDNFKSLPKELQTALRSARLPDGRLLITMPEMIRTIGGLNSSQSGQHIPSPPQGSQAAMQAELAEIDALMHRDIDDYHRPWRNTGRSASERKLEIMRRLDAPDPNPQQTRANLENEKRELIRLRDRDPQMFQFGNWRGSGRPASDRLVALQSGRS